MDTVEETDDEGDWEGDLEEDSVTETVTLVDRVAAPLEEVLRDTDPDRVTDGERERLGEVEIVNDVEELGQRVADRVELPEREGLWDIDGEAVYVLDTVGDTLCEGEGEAFELALEDREFERVSVTEEDEEGKVDTVEETDDEGD